jgi:MinD superfamily P-loop ATPase
MFDDLDSEMTEMPRFEPEKCNGCLLCLSICVHGGFTLSGETIIINAEAECDYCQQCELVCPTGAISFPFDVVEEP